jgi:hypothetical protein
LGTSTDAQKWGDVWVTDDHDVYPDGDTAGLATRNINHWAASIEERFRSAFEWLTTGWAAAPFNGTPNTVDWSEADLLRLNDNVQNDRFFRYRSINDPTDDDWRLTARLMPTVGCNAGIRIDSGNDTNFAEVYFRQDEAGATYLMDVVSRYQEAGGGITTTVHLTGLPVMWGMVRIYATGATNLIYPYYGIDQVVDYLHYVGGPTVGDLDNWNAAPSRVGIIYSRTSASLTGRSGFYDWFDVIGITPS